jgi:hypothetical protein
MFFMCVYAHRLMCVSGCSWMREGDEGLREPVDESATTNLLSQCAKPLLFEGMARDWNRHFNKKKY